MGVTVVEMASNALLTTRERAKAELGLTTTTADDVISDMIVRASSAIARETRRVFGVETVTETLDGTGTRLLGLSRTPIVEVTEVTEDGEVLDTAEYSVEDAEAGALYRANGWGRSGGLRMWGTEAFSSGYVLPGYREQRYAVTYRAGYLLPSDVDPFMGSDPTLQNLPGAVEQACLETVKAWYLGSKAAQTSLSAGTTGEVTSAQVGALRLGFGSSSRSSSSSSSSAAIGSLPQSALGLLRNYYQRPLS